MDKPDFNSFTILNLTLAYNDMAREVEFLFGTGPDARKSFRTKPQAVDACTDLWDQIKQAKEATPVSDVTSQEESPTQEPEVAATEEAAPKRRGPKPLTDEEKAARKAAKDAAKPPKVAKVAKAPKAAKAETGTRGARVKYAETDRITTLVDENPKREGSEQHRLWGFYKGNPTVAKFIERVGDKKMARLRLGFDVARELIKIGPATKKEAAAIEASESAEAAA